MGLLPSDGKRQWPTEPAAVRTPDIPLVPIIQELAARKEADARDAWHRNREQWFTERLHANYEELDEMMLRLATATKKEATLRKYQAHWSRFKKFAADWKLDDDFGMRPLPACPALVVCFLMSEKSYSAIKQAAAAISDAHVVNKLPDPTQSLEVRAMLRIARHGKVPKVELDGKESEQAKPNGKANGKHTEAAHEEP